MTGADPLIQEFVQGRYVDRTTGKTIPCSLQKVVTTESTQGQETELLSGLDGELITEVDVFPFPDELFGHLVDSVEGDVPDLVVDRLGEEQGR